jgi:hypothetical protein
MARKTLLNESEIRRFLKLANVGAIGDSRLQEISGDGPNEGVMGAVGELVGQRDDEEEEEVEEGLMGAAGELIGQRDEEGEDDLDMGAEEGPVDDMPADDPEMDMDAEPEGDGQMVSVDDFMSALESALEDVMGEPTSVEMSDDEEPLDEPGGEEVEMDMEMGPEEDEAALQEDKKANVGHGPGKEVKDGNGKPSGRWLKEDEELDEDADALDEEEIVNEVARRVAERLVNEKKKTDMADALADRILKRLTK